MSERCRLQPRVTIGARTIVYDNVDVGEESVVGPNVTLGEPQASYYSDKDYENPLLRIGRRSLIRSGSIIYAGSELGEHFECGHHVTVRERSQIAAHCRVGTLSDIQGDCSIGEYTRLHSNVHVAQGSVIGRYVWLFPYVVLTNDAHPPSEQRAGVTIDDYAVVATGAVLLAGVRVGSGALVGANSVVREDVPAMTVVAGRPATQLGDVRLIRSPDTGQPLYPWPRRFTRGMPWEEMGYEAWSRDASGADS
ncbi:MAG: N-acetyltransferase [Actinomycetota bacterium]|nr:N-acetyltransferase [Actinomycetota bacterium]